MACLSLSLYLIMGLNIETEFMKYGARNPDT